MGKTATTNHLTALCARVMMACIITLLVGLTSNNVQAQVLEGTVAGHELRLQATEGDVSVIKGQLFHVRGQANCLNQRYIELVAIMETKASAARVLRLERWKDETEKVLRDFGLRIDGLDIAVSRAQAAIDSQGGLLSLTKGKVDDLDRRVQELTAKIDAVARQAARAKSQAENAQQTAESKQDQIRFSFQGVAWTLGIGGAATIEIPLRDQWSVEGTFGAGRGYQGFASLGQVVAVRKWTVWDDHLLAFRFGGFWASDSLSSGTRAYTQKELGGTVGAGWQWWLLDVTVDAGACWDAPQKNGEVKDRAAICGAIKAGFRF